MTIAESLATAPAQRVGSRAAAAAGVVMRRVADSQWDSLAARFGGLCQEQLLTFASTRWPSATHEPVVFGAADELIGGALVSIQPLPFKLGSIAFTKWGPMLADTRRPDALRAYAGMVEALIDEYCDRRGMLLSVMGRAAVTPNNPHYQYLMARGFRPGSLLNYPLRYLVNLRLSDDAQRLSLEASWRRKLRKSEKAGLAFEHAGADRLAEFTALYERMLERKRFADYSAYETVPGLLSLDDPELRPELFFVRHEGEVVAGAIVFKGGDRAVYLYGATLDRALPLHAGYFLHWNIICWLHDNSSAEWYDLGGTDGFQGLHQFKKGMVGSAGAITPVPRVANYAASPWAYATGAGALRARDALQGVLRGLSRLRRDRAQPDLKRYDERPRTGAR